MRACVPLATIVALASAGGALAEGFTIGAIDAGGITGSNPLAGISVTGEIYQNAFGSDFEPGQTLLDIVPEIEFDSYLTIDRGPVLPAPGYDGSDVAAASFAPGSAGFSTNSVTGSWFVSGAFVDSFLNTSTGLHEVFVARITHTGVLNGYLGTTLSEDNATTRTVGSDLGATFDSDSMGANLEQGYTWLVRQSTAMINGIEYTVSDIYLQQVPAPSALGLLGAGGMIAARRRRR